MKEACVTVGYICNTLGGEASSFAGVMVQELIPHLSSTVKVMASSADVCITYIIKVSFFMWSVWLMCMKLTHNIDLSMF